MQKKFKDLDVLFISLQLMVLLVSRIKDLKISHANFFKNPKIIKDIYDNHEATISATTIAEVTGLPRTTCIRKLNSMMKSKMITQNKLTKGFCLIPEFFSKNLASEKTNQEVVKIFSEFFLFFLKR